jgi:hypothetical protein
MVETFAETIVVVDLGMEISKTADIMVCIFSISRKAFKI